MEKSTDRCQQCLCQTISINIPQFSFCFKESTLSSPVERVLTKWLPARQDETSVKQRKRPQGRFKQRLCEMIINRLQFPVELVFPVRENETSVGMNEYRTGSFKPCLCRTIFINILQFRFCLKAHTQQSPRKRVLREWLPARHKEHEPGIQRKKAQGRFQQCLSDDYYYSSVQLV